MFGASVNSFDFLARLFYCDPPVSENYCLPIKFFVINIFEELSNCIYNKIYNHCLNARDWRGAVCVDELYRPYCQYVVDLNLSRCKNKWKYKCEFVATEQNSKKNYNYTDKSVSRYSITSFYVCFFVLLKAIYWFIHFID